MDQAHLQNTIEKLEFLRKKQNTEIDELIVSLQTKATIDTGAGTNTKPIITALQVKDKVSIRNTGKYLCNTGTISKINKQTNVNAIVLTSGQKTTRLLKNLEPRTTKEE